jgi:hypothetical protein
MKRLAVALALSIALAPAIGLAQARTQFPSTVMLDAATATSSSANFKPATGVRTFQAYGATSSGAGAATIVIEVSNIEAAVNSTNVDWITAGTITLTLATTRSSDGFTMDAPWRNVRARVTAISGTGAAVSVVMGNAQ